MARFTPFTAILAAGALCSTIALSHAGLAIAFDHPGAEARASAPSALSAVLTTTATATLPTPTVPVAAAEAVANVQATPTQVIPVRAAGAQATPSAEPRIAGAVAMRASGAGLDSYAEKAASLFDRMNNARKKDGQGTLTRDTRLDEVALARANNLVANSYFDHYAPDGESAFTELADREIRYRLAGENLARNNYSESRTAQAAFDGLMASPGHRANILESRFSRVGVATVRANGLWIYVTVFMD